MTGATGRQGRSALRHLAMPVAIGRDFYQMFRWFNTGGFNARHRRPAADYPQLRLRTLEDWMRKEGRTGKRAITVCRDNVGRPPPAAPPLAAVPAGR